MQQSRISVKEFVSKLESVLLSSSKEQLAEIIRQMANNLSSEDRCSFLSKLQIKKNENIDDNKLSNNLLIKIDNLVSEISDAMDDEEIMEDYWNDHYGEHDDEDPLGPFEKFIPDITYCMIEIEKAFEKQDHSLVANAFLKLKKIFEMENNYDCRIDLNDLQKIDLREFQAKYLRSILLSKEHDSNPEAFFTHLLNSHKLFNPIIPSLKDIVEISCESSKFLESFLDEWIEFLLPKLDKKYSFYLREAYFLKFGISGFKKLTTMAGKKDYRIYFDWAKLLDVAEKYDECITVCKTAIDAIPAGNPIRATISDIGKKNSIVLDDKKNAEYFCWISFEERPSLEKLFELVVTYTTKRDLYLEKAVNVIEKELKANRTPNEDKWEIDNVEDYAYIDKSLLLHVYLLQMNITNAFNLIKNLREVGWSSRENGQPLFISFLYNLIGKQDLYKHTKNQREFYEQALTGSIYTNLAFSWNTYRNYNKDDLVDKIKTVHNDLIKRSTLSVGDLQTEFSWAVEQCKKRIDSIVSNKHRDAYARAALITAVTSEAFESIGENRMALNFITKIKSDYSRHSAFQNELKRVF